MPVIKMTGFERAEDRDALPVTFPGTIASSHELWGRLQEKINARRARAEAQGIDFACLAEGRVPAPAGAGGLSRLDENLRLMGLSYNRIGVQLAPIEGGPPLIGGVWRSFRASLHQAIVYYVNILAGRQAVFNRYVLDALSQVRDVEDASSPSELRLLREQVSTLQARVQDLEERLATREDA